MLSFLKQWNKYWPSHHDEEYGSYASSQEPWAVEQAIYRDSTGG